jgi:hypothetical protein
MSARILASHPAERAMTKPGPSQPSQEFCWCAVHPKQARLNLYEELVKQMRAGLQARIDAPCLRLLGNAYSRGMEAEASPHEGERMLLLILIILLLVFGFGGYRLGPGIGYYGGGGISLIILIVIILLLLKVI